MLSLFLCVYFGNQTITKHERLFQLMHITDQNAEKITCVQAEAWPRHDMHVHMLPLPLT